MAYFALLDALRGIAAVAVVLLHALIPWNLAEEVVPHAALGVDFFFVLSGFVLAHAYEGKLLDRMSCREFLMRRWIRLYPMIAIGLSLGVLVYLFRIAIQSRPELLLPVIQSACLNAVLLPSPFLLAEHSNPWDINPPHWSLSYEAVASVIFGLVLYRIKGWRFVALTGLAAGGIVYSVAVSRITDNGSHWNTLSLGLLRVAFPFMVGVLLYRRQSAQRVGATVPVLLLIGMMVVRLPPAYTNAYEAVCILLITPLIVWLGAGVVLTGAAERLARWLGQISYPLYATHYPVIKMSSFLIRKLNFVEPATLMAIAGAQLLASLGLAWVLLRHVDEPVRAWLSRQYLPAR